MHYNWVSISDSTPFQFNGICWFCVTSAINSLFGWRGWWKFLWSCVYMVFVLFLSPCFFVMYEVFFESPNTIADGVLVDNDHASYRSHLSILRLRLNMHHTLSSFVCAQWCQELIYSLKCLTVSVYPSAYFLWGLGVCVGWWVKSCQITKIEKNSTNWDILILCENLWYVETLPCTYLPNYPPNAVRH